ncbi:LysR family transcriptional regulator [Paraburkholderia caribensis]|uniref:LysR family transcriptional regulator n=1 Tax=Paraburkholderia caribensis TaxID=75105 RepID=UPI0031CED23C
MKLHQLEALIALVDAGSVRAAARRLDITQPAMTSRIVELEREVGTALVNRTSHGTSLTPAGRALFAHAKAIGHHLRRAEEEISQLTDLKIATVSVGSSPLAAMELLAPLIDSVQTAAKRIQIQVIEGQFHEMSVALREGALDMVIAPLPVKTESHNIYNFEQLAAYPLYVVARVGHRFEQCTSISQIAEAHWIVGATTTLQLSTLEELYLHYHLGQPTIAVRADAVTMVQAAVATSELLALLPRPMFVNWKNITALQLKEPIRPMKLGLITLAGSPLTPAAERLAVLIRARSREVANALALERAG